MWRACTPDDQEMLAELFKKHLTFAMFPACNLRDFGLNGEAPNAMRIWWDGHNALCLTNSGSLMPVADGMKAVDWAALKPLLKGEQINRLIGRERDAQNLKDAFALHHSTNYDQGDPAYKLNLDAIKMPDCDGFSITHIGPETQAIAIDWRSEFNQHTLGMPTEEARSSAATFAQQTQTTQSHVLLMQGDQPVSMTGVTAKIAQMVLVGGVYTPPQFRAQGHARRAVALHLRALAQEGIERAILGAANENAAKAYTAIGFERNDTFRYTTFSAPVTL